MLKITSVGMAVYNLIFKLESLPTSEGEFPALDFFEEGGGPAATASVTAAKCGAKSSLISRVGNDYRGSLIIDELKSYNVDITHIKTIDGARSSLSTVLVSKNGARIISNYLDPKLDDDPSWIIDEMILKNDIILADVRWVKGALKAFSIAHKNHIPTILDADVSTEDITNLLPLTDHCIFSKQGLINLTGTSDIIEGLYKAKRLIKGVVYVTLGESGCYWLEDSLLKHFSGYKVDVIDTSGAGDVFHGAFAVSIAEVKNIEKAIQFASATAAIKCTKQGTRKGIPTRNEIESFIQQNNIK